MIYLLKLLGFHYRKKKLTNHWRSFIRPLMWRCKWAELRINEIQSQALKYARELAAYDQNKLSRVNQSTVEEFGSKSLAFSSQWYRKKAMKRRKRKRAEDTTDLASYMSHHSLFSYLGIKLVLCSCTSWCECFAFIPPPFPFLFIISDSFLLCRCWRVVLQKTSGLIQMEIQQLMILVIQVTIYSACFLQP